MTCGLTGPAWLLVALIATAVGSGSPGVAGFATCVFAVVIAVLATKAARPVAPQPMVVPRTRRLTSSTTVLRQYAPAEAGRPQPRAPGRKDCAGS